MLIADAKDAGQGNPLPRIVEETLIDGGKNAMCIAKSRIFRPGLT